MLSRVLSALEAPALLAVSVVMVAFAAADALLDIVLGVATAGVLAGIWRPWGRSIRRAVAKYDLSAR